MVDRWPEKFALEKMVVTFKSNIESLASCELTQRNCFKFSDYLTQATFCTLRASMC